jgi:alanine racemase
MADLTPRPTFAEVDLANLRFNFRSSRDFIGHDVKYMAVVKANAYGHGAIECAKALADEGVDWFGVALLEEAMELRDAGTTQPILCLGGLAAGQADDALRLKITPVVFSLDQIAELDAAASRSSRASNLHIKIDTGMGRLGVRWDDLDSFIDRLSSFKNITVGGLMTHFASANDPAENEFTDTQIDRFFACVKKFETAGFDPVIVDLANSPGAVGHPRSRAQMVRLGGILYGLGGDVLAPELPKPELRPVMSLHSAIADVKKVPAGQTLGYGRTFTTDRDSRIGLVPIGYHDGYRRGLSNKAQVIINGQFANVVGRISMDWTIVDVTPIQDIKIGDPVTLIGIDGDAQIKAEDLAGLLDTISYEITCGISSRVPRRSVDK